MTTLLLERVFTCKDYTVGHLYSLSSNGHKELICDVIEDCDRGLTSSMSLNEISNIKVKCQTAIPTGIYKITLNVFSPSFGKRPYYANFCNGKLPRLLNVKGFDGILMHRGVDASSSCGCLILGYNTNKGQVTNSQMAFEKTYNILLKALKENNNIDIEIISNYK